MHTQFSHTITYVDFAGHSCCPGSVQQCPHCFDDFCYGHHLETFKNDSDEHNCCSLSLGTCNSCLGVFCRTHTTHTEFKADGCDHFICPETAEPCPNCGTNYCQKCITTELKLCKASSLAYCESCKPCEKCAPVDSKSLGTKSTSSIDTLPFLLARHDSQTIAKPSKQSLTLLHIDVDQGACTLVLYTNPKGEKWTAVIDGGHGNPGRGQIFRYLNALGYTKIDALFLSHHDADHADGLSDLIENHTKFFSDGDTKLYVPYDNSSHSIKNFLNDRRITRIKPTVTIKNEDGFVIKPFYGTTQKDENGRSLALHISLGKFSYLTCGDLPTNQGEDFVAHSVGAVDVLFCSHHGSAHSTSDSMLATLKYPPISVISAGRNGYGHPNTETIQRYANCIDKRPDLKIYLTGCQYNRKYINPNYYERELLNHQTSIKELFKHFKLAPNPETLKNVVTALNDGLLFCEEEGLVDENIVKLKKYFEETLVTWLEKDNTKGLAGLSLDKECETVNSLVERCYKDMSWKQAKTPLIGFVSGTSSKMGPVGIRILPPPNDWYVDVGFCPEAGYCPSDRIEWKWRHRWVRGKEDKLFYAGEIFETGGEIDDATPKLAGGDESPKTYETWFNIRNNQRNAFSLSTRTNRQPDIKVKYKCRREGCLENKKGYTSNRKYTRMILVSCEYCIRKGTPVAYHEACFLNLILPNAEFDKWIDEELKDSPSEYMTNIYPKLKWGDKKRHYQDMPHHPLWEQIADFIEQRESPEIPVIIPTKFEACYFCATFRPTRSLPMQWGTNDDKELKRAIRSRREEFKEEAIGASRDFSSNDKFQKFYESQLEINEFQRKLK